MFLQNYSAHKGLTHIPLDQDDRDFAGNIELIFTEFSSNELDECCVLLTRPSLRISLFERKSYKGIKRCIFLKNFQFSNDVFFLRTSSSHYCDLLI